jgi:glutamine synthetase
MTHLSPVDFERVRVLFPDHLGLARGKYLPPELVPNGTGHSAALFALGYDRSMIPAPGSYLLEGLIDVHATFDPATLRHSWEDHRTGVAIADLTLDGVPYPVAARHVLKEAVAEFAALGYAVDVGVETEAYLLQPGKDGGWERYENPRALVYGTGIGNDPDGVIDAIMTIATECGFRLEAINAEFDESQYELTLQYSDALAAADEIFLFRTLAREVALANGLDLTFLGKPFPEISGSGLHVNMSLVDAEGRNAFEDVTSDDGLSDLARHAIAGLCAHHQALAAVCAPTVNAYRRLRPAQLAGYWANWGYDHRCVATRVPPARGAGTRIESRVGDGAANIHLAIAAVLTAARLGITGALACPPAETGDGFEEANTDVCAPANLSEALDQLESDTEFFDAFGRDCAENFVANKRAEWDRFVAAEGVFDGAGPITTWERNEYLMYH